MKRFSTLIFIVVLAFSLAITQFLTYQQYKLIKEANRAELTHEATEVKDRFRNILFNDIAAANTLAIIYKQYGVPDNFDSIAHQIITNSRYAEALQITENGIVKCVYPDRSYKTTIGTNVDADPVRKAEEDRAIKFKDIYFAGPRALRFGDTGILGKVPIIAKNKTVVVATVLTRLGTIKKALDSHGKSQNRFAYELKDTVIKGGSFFLLSNKNGATGSEFANVHIPEGDWVLRISYAKGYSGTSFPIRLSIVGILFSIVTALLAYRKVEEPYKLKKIIDEKTSQLVKSERYFRTLIETRTDALRLLDANGKAIYQTPSTEKITGYSLIERQNLNAIDLIHPDGVSEEKREYQKALDNPGKVIPRKVQFKHKNGHYIWIEGSYQNLLNDENIGAIVMSYSDVTERVKFEQSLIESETRFRRAFEDSAIGMGLSSVEKGSLGKWLKVNRSLCDMLGYTEDELLSLSFMQITHPEDLSGDLEAQNRLLCGDIDTYRVEKRYIRKNGSIVWINLNVSMVRDKDEKPMYLVAQIENISEKVESQIKFQNLVENFVVGVYILRDKKLVYVNPRLIEETGYREDEVIDMPVDHFVYPQDLKLVSEMIDQRNNGDMQASRFEARIQRKDGELIWYEIFGSSIIYNGTPAMIGTMININERKRLTLELLSHVKAIEEQNNKLREIAWVQSHVVRAPLARLMGLIDMLKDEDNNDKKILDYISISAEELDDVIKNITDKVYIDEDSFKRLT